MDRYRIRVRGQLDPQWSEWLNGMEITAETYSSEKAEEPPLSTLEGTMPDQAALRGIMNKLWDLNLNIIFFSIVDEDELNA